MKNVDENIVMKFIANKMYEQCESKELNLCTF
jgi:hypothetical protein